MTSYDYVSVYVDQVDIEGYLNCFWLLNDVKKINTYIYI